jgi:hypothetical protein
VAILASLDDEWDPQDFIEILRVRKAPRATA